MKSIIKLVKATNTNHMANDNAIDRDVIREALKRHSVTHADVAAAIGVARPTVSLWMSQQISIPKLDFGIPAYVAGLERSRSAA